MVDSWVVAPLSQDFSQDFDKLLIAYLENKYSIADPDKDNTPDKNIVFKFGFFTFETPYEITVLEQETAIDQYVNPYTYMMGTAMDINIRMERLDPNGTDPQLGYMRREIVRILGAYVPYEIPGILELRWVGGNPYYIPNTDRDAHAEQDWRYIIRCRLIYQMNNTTTI